jgi:hypothetical protein
MHFLPKLQTSSAMEGASFVSKKTGEFSPENSWVKIAWMQFLPALQGSACASLPNGNGYAALPIGARLFGKKDFSSANENVAKKSTAGTGGVGESPFRRECAARPEEWSRRAEPRKRHTRGMFGSKKNRQSQEQVPQKKRKKCFP